MEQNAHGGAIPQVGYLPLYHPDFENAGDGIPAVQGTGAAGRQYPL